MSQNNQRPIIEAKEHNHCMVYNCTIANHCRSVKIYTCQDSSCGYWTEELVPGRCNMEVTRYSTRVTCYECTTCGRKTTESS